MKTIQLCVEQRVYNINGTLLYAGDSQSCLWASKDLDVFILASKSETTQTMTYKVCTQEGQSSEEWDALDEAVALARRDVEPTELELLWLAPTGIEKYWAKTSSTLYDQNGFCISEGLPPSTDSCRAFECARSSAASRGECVVLEDDGDFTVIIPAVLMVSENHDYGVLGTHWLGNGGDSHTFTNIEAAYDFIAQVTRSEIASFIDLCEIHLEGLEETIKACKLFVRGRAGRLASFRIVEIWEEPIDGFCEHPSCGCGYSFVYRHEVAIKVES